MRDAKTNPAAEFEIGQISDEFLEKYNRPGPRYTSYPTAPVWKDDFGPDDLEEYYARADALATPLSLYMHLPFCESLCLFCACNCFHPEGQGRRRSLPRRAETRNRARRANGFEKAPRDPISLGRRHADLSFSRADGRSFRHARERFSFAPDAEIGIEVDPRVTSRAHLETLRRLGFNRLSMGIQDFEPKVQETIHRVQPYEMTRDLILAARELGFESLNVDLIYGLPYQTAESFEETIDQVLTLAPDRVAMFSYAHVPWLKKAARIVCGASAGGPREIQNLPRRAGKISRRGLSLHRHGPLCAGRGRAGDRAANRTLHRNFQGYTTKAGADLYGMGVSAISSIGGAYAQNRREVPAYQAAVAERGIATMRGYRLSPDDQIRRAVIGRLLCHTVIPKHEVEREFAISFDEYFAPELEQLEEPRAEGLVALEGDEIRVTPLGRIFIRNVAMIFDRYLREQQMDKRPLFSKTL